MVKAITIRFEDKGQDFLEWKIEEVPGLKAGKRAEKVFRVVDSRPFQAEIWRGTALTRLKLGEQPLVAFKAGNAFRLLNYKVTKITK